MKVVSFSLEQGNKYFGRVDGGPKFFIGKRVSFDGNKGLMNVTGTAAEKYDRTAFAACLIMPPRIRVYLPPVSLQPPALPPPGMWTCSAVWARPWRRRRSP